MSNKKKKKVRLRQAESLEHFAVIINHVEAYGLDGEGVVELRQRSARGEAWDPVPEGHLFNTERYNYRIGEEVRIALDGQTVEIEGGDEERPLSWVKRIIALARRCRKNKKALFIRAGSEDADPDHNDVHIRESGSVKVGCKEFTWEEIETFEKRYLRKRK